MKQVVIALALCLCQSVCIGQYTIWDAEFRQELNQIVPDAMNGIFLDTLHPDVLNLTSMDISGGIIYDLDGIQFFTSLEDLDCSSNVIGVINELPNKIKSLNLSNNHLSILPPLPDSLETLNLYDNTLYQIPPLPSTLMHLECGDNFLDSLPTLPIHLNYLGCHRNYLSSLPELPDSLIQLTCTQNELDSLPPLPSTLDILHCSDNLMYSLPALPQKMTYLSCGGINLTALPDLPDSLIELTITEGLITSLPPLSPNLYRLDIENTLLELLPPLPIGLGILGCAQNELSALPILPQSIHSIYCMQNNLTAVPTLPPLLTYLNCSENQITSLPELLNLTTLRCSYNQIDCLPRIPETLNTLYCSNNNIVCLPNIPDGFTPNSIQLGFDPLICNITTTSCPLYQETINGLVFIDADSNGVKDPGELPFTLAHAMIEPGNHSAGTDSMGRFAIPVDTGTFVLEGQDILYRIKTTVPDTITLGALEVDTGNYIGYFPIPGIYDLNVDLSAEPARNGFDNNIWLQVLNIGTESATCEVNYAYDVDQGWISSEVIPDSFAGDTASWNISIEPGETWSNKVVLHTDPAITIGTPIHQAISVLTLQPDSTPENNVDSLNTEVIGSFDPNDKLLEPTSMSPMQVIGGKAIEYTIRFQNTGTYHAERVVITDTLSADLDWSTMQFVSSSHKCTWYLQDGVLHFVHDPIFLPDSTSDEPGSHGYVKFRMNPVNTLMVGAQIENVANIYFDFNEPVITEPAIFSVSIPTEILELERAGFEMYPNPTNGNVQIVSSERIHLIEVLQLDGRIVHAVSGNSTNVLLDVSALAAGTYLVSVQSQNGTTSSELLLVQ